MSSDQRLMRYLMRCAALFVALVSVSIGAHGANGSDQDMVSVGRRIYREGILPSGQPVQGLAAANVRLAGAQAACAACHRRSGYGSSEGPIEVRAITGLALFGHRVAPTLPYQVTPADAATASPGRSGAEVARATANALHAGRAEMFSGARQRPTYDDVSLGRAIRDGLDVTGRAMNPSMPRFALDTVAMASLTAYLKTLSVQASPGVTEDAVHFATVIQPGTDLAQRQALIDVLQTYIQDRNKGLRAEVRREASGMVRLKRTYREWVMHVWDLHGASDAWAGQLEAYNAQQPVFALLSGLGNTSWRPIHEFSERFEIPCILPQVDVPVLAEHDFYTVYLSRGMTLEAQALAKFLLSQSGHGPLTQVYGPDGASATGAAALREAWTRGGGTQLVDHVVHAVPDRIFWRQLAQQTPGATLVLWLAPGYFEQAQVLTETSSKVKAIYLSSNLIANHRTGLAADGGGRVRLVLSEDLPSSRQARLDVVRRWLTSKGLALSDEKVQMNAYLAATVTGLMMSHSMDTYSREFLLERMEHLLGNSLETSIYPRLSLGPGQRYASKGSYIVELAGAQEWQLRPVSDWIVP